MLREMYEDISDVNKPQIQFINKVDFVWGLRCAFESFLQDFPENDEKWSLVGDDTPSSLSRKYIRDVLEKQFWKCFRRIIGENPRQFIICDDAIYSGDQMRDTIQRLQSTTRSHITIALIAPYMTQKWKRKVLWLSDDKTDIASYDIHCLQTTLSGKFPGWFEHKMPDEASADHRLISALTNKKEEELKAISKRNFKDLLLSV